MKELSKNAINYLQINKLRPLRDGPLLAQQ